MSQTCPKARSTASNCTQTTSTCTVIFEKSIENVDKDRPHSINLKTGKMEKKHFEIETLVSNDILSRDMMEAVV